MATPKIGRQVRSDLGLIEGFKIQHPEKFKTIAHQKTSDGWKLLTMTFENGKLTVVDTEDCEDLSTLRERYRIETAKAYLDLCNG